MGKIVLSNSKVSTFLACPKKYYWGYIRGLQPKRLYLPFTVGASIHQALAFYYSKMDKKQSLAVFTSNMWEEFKSAGCSEDYTEEFSKHVKAGWDLLTAYFKTYQNDKFSVLQPELSFEVCLDANESIYLTGIMDAIINEGGKFKLLEHKTTSQLDARTIERLAHSPQLPIYLLGVNKSLDLNVRAVKLNLLRKIRVDSLSSKPAFERPPDVMFTKANLLKITEWLITVGREIRRLGDFSAIIENRYQCHGMMSECAFHPLCEYGEDESILKEYKQKEEK